MSEIWPKSYEKLVSYAEDKHTNSIYISEENHCEHRAINDSRDYVNHIKIDGKVILKACRDTKRIDFLLLNETKKIAYFIELKGSHIKDALEAHTGRICGSVEDYPPSFENDKVAHERSEPVP